MVSDVLASGSRGTHGLNAFGHPVADCQEIGADPVSGADKAKNKAQDLGGKAKEAVGKVTGDKSTENEGKGDQAKSNLKDAGEKVKDAFRK
jgi:uncharacterized protein YjbJ (UPF0337 family)